VARAAKVSIRTGTDVAEIVVRDDRVAGVALASGEEITAPVVLSTLDPASTIRKVDPVWLDPDFLHAVQKIKFRGVRATALFAMDGLPDTTGLDGVVSCTPTTVALEKAYDAAKYGENSERPHVEFSVPTLRWPDLAPAGKHVVVAHAQWMAARSNTSDGSIADLVIHVLDESMPGFASRIRHRSVLSPRQLGERYGLTEGAVTHGELTLDQIMFMRPVPGSGQYAMPVAGLYLGGAGAHPGPGVLGGPGWLSARRVLGDMTLISSIGPLRLSARARAPCPASTTPLLTSSRKRPSGSSRTDGTASGGCTGSRSRVNGSRRRSRGSR